MHLCRFTAPKPYSSCISHFRQEWRLSHTELSPASAATIATIVCVCQMHELAYPAQYGGMLHSESNRIQPNNQTHSKTASQRQGITKCNKNNVIFITSAIRRWRQDSRPIFEPRCHFAYANKIKVIFYATCILPRLFPDKCCLITNSNVLCNSPGISRL